MKKIAYIALWAIAALSLLAGIFMLAKGEITAWRVIDGNELEGTVSPFQVDLKPAGLLFFLLGVMVTALTLFGEVYVRPLAMARREGDQGGENNAL
ncbi:hypothetical protein [Klugiella xanthotipulae]|uniref:Uncharacterized protein n=1 Tax=Klugiella xanthotipulae TaxID=244735 RepID=A0A543HY31_9MICO|nr:hypothetical protein [Klugiella xanthotipulae]TQM63180.1 hypothetical protein FB466_1435 [Klugiella xanthotipulae]